MRLLSERLAYIYAKRPDLEGDRGQSGFIRAAGASKSVVNQWLNDKIKSIDIRYALSIERALGFDHVWLMTGDGEPELVRQTRGNGYANLMSTQIETADELRLLTAYRLSDEVALRGFQAAIDAALERANAKTVNKA